MNKHWFSLLAFASPFLSYANNLSFTASIGFSSNGHQTKALLLENFNEITAYEALENFRGVIINDYDNISTKTALQLSLLHFFIEEDKTGKAWENTTKTVYLTPVEIMNVVLGVSAAHFKFTDNTLLTGTDSTPNSLTDDITNTNTVPGFFTFNGLNVSTDSHTKYTAIDNDVSLVPQIAAYAISNKNFLELESLKNELLPTVSNAINHLDAQKHYTTLDSGISAVYDFGQMQVFVKVSGHYPVDLVSPRESIPLISFSPSFTIDTAIGSTFTHGKGKIGGSVGISRIRGDFVLKKYLRSTSADNDLNLGYVNYTHSYNEGNNSITISKVSELFYFAELLAESNKLKDNGFSIYAGYKMGFGRESGASILSKLELRKDSIVLGASYSLIETEL